MNMIHYRPWTQVQRLTDNLDSLFSSSRINDGDETRTFSDWLPPVDIREEDQRFVIAADIPGVNPDDIEVTLENNVLTLRGERDELSDNETSSVRRYERRQGKFLRRFTLPDTVDAETVTARSTHGVLEVTISKRAEISPRRIAVTAN